MKSLNHGCAILGFIAVLACWQVFAQGIRGTTASPAFAERTLASTQLAANELALGLVTEYRSLKSGATDFSPLLSRIETKPAFTLLDSSLHPRLPPGPFEARWS